MVNSVLIGRNVVSRGHTMLIAVRLQKRPIFSGFSQSGHIAWLFVLARPPATISFESQAATVGLSFPKNSSEGKALD
jgi:hypothetical protein